MPAAGFASLTGAYDTIMAVTMRENAWRPALAGQILEGLEPSGVIVDVGSGSGSQVAALSRDAPGAVLVAVDGDEQMIEIGRRKAGAANVRFVQGLAGELPLPAGSADRVVLSLVLHHLDPRPTRDALGEAVRILKPGGRVHVADWGRPSLRSAPGFRLLQAVDGVSNTREHAAGALPRVLLECGLQAVRLHGRLDTVWGTLELLSAVRP